MVVDKSAWSIWRPKIKGYSKEPTISKNLIIKNQMLSVCLNVQTCKNTFLCQHTIILSLKTVEGNNYLQIKSKNWPFMHLPYWLIRENLKLQRNLSTTVLMLQKNFKCLNLKQNYLLYKFQSTYFWAKKIIWKTIYLIFTRWLKMRRVYGDLWAPTLNKFLWKRRKAH